ncbi:E3 ubiquitin-protein ligase HECTD3-like [Asterias rubens]|uniref:E3 ubiquitin-protein ligase HECTD3-like n=1 Tax=Asterias rubens TaxID=7604 RepID=UPI0014557859|nr:E3 ubiquitin-protein ligase HECTD3-like [Asterias rubens]
MGSAEVDGKPLDTRAILARIRCLQESIECFRISTTLPKSLCYVTGEIEYKIHPTFAGRASPRSRTTNGAGSRRTPRTTRVKLGVYAVPSKDCPAEQQCHVYCGKDTRIVASGEEMCNSFGSWIRLTTSCLEKLNAFSGSDIRTGWLLIYESKANQDDPPPLVPITEEEMSERREMLFGKQEKVITNWLAVVEETHMLKLGSMRKISPSDDAAVKTLQTVPQNWSLECDEELARFLFEKTDQVNELLGSNKQYINSVVVSSTAADDEDANCLTDGDENTYWTSDGTHGQHWIRINMKKGTIITKLSVTVDSQDDNYMPDHIIVMGGTIDNLKKLKDINVDVEFSGDICLLEQMSQHYPVIEIRIKSCHDDGIDCRIHAIKLVANMERHLGISKDVFSETELVRYPRLELVDKEHLYRRALVLQRFITLLDGVIHFIVPAWEYTLGSFSSLEVVRQLLPLSKKRNAIIRHFLKASETSQPQQIPKLYINRRSASEHRGNPSQDPSCKNAVFTQIYEGLKPKDRSEKSLDFRWPDSYDQWWECKFLSEGIIDQGGGFRDSLADIAEELCPVGGEHPVPLPFFIRTLNQQLDNSNVYRDMYVPNPSCKLFAKYEWIGMLMGACLRSKEHLVLALPSFIWKILAGERVTWTRDFKTVDEAAVKLLESFQKMDKETFETNFASEMTFTTVLSDQSEVMLTSRGSEAAVAYEDRMEWCRLVQSVRMNENKDQVDAMRRGLLRVVPQAVLDLLTWQELEKKVCGDPEISVEALRKTSFFEDLEKTDTRVKYLWEALTNFTNEDRSRFLRFVTGRRRLPTPLYICPGRSYSSDNDMTDSLPESSTCSNTLFLPNYSSAKVAEEKLRYAAYNCVAIDTDMSPWDE